MIAHAWWAYKVCLWHRPHAVTDWLTLPMSKAKGVLGSSRRLATSGLPTRSSGRLSPSVSRSQRSVGSRMPSGTVQCFCQDVQGGIVISVQHHATARTDVSTDRETLVHPRAALRAGLTGEVGFDRDHGDAMHRPIILHPAQKCSPCGIVNGLCQVAVLDQVA